MRGPIRIEGVRSRFRLRLRLRFRLPSALVTVRKATAADEDVIVSVLVRAFDNDPVARFLLRERDYPGALDLMFRAFFRHMVIPHGEVWIDDSGGGAALWTPPGRWDVSILRTLVMGPALLRAAGLRAVSSARGMLRMQALHPREAHYYLFAIGVDPAFQGRGIGSALLHAGLSQCDAAAESAYLEASTEGSSRLYARHGFRVTQELEVRPGAPPVWLMWRNKAPVVA
jgi:ribosomal protein S18 acetylase RimI-like enzyme